MRKKFHIAGPLKPIATRVNFKLKSDILKMLSENFAGYKRSINENPWLNILGVMLLFTLNIKVKDVVECLFGIHLKYLTLSLKASAG